MCLKMKTREMIRIAFSAVLLTLLCSCQSLHSYDSRYFDYSGKDGCTPPNIGHRLGGDVGEFGDNTVEGLLGIAPLQRSNCFKNWEFDLNQALDSLVLFHDSAHNGKDISLLRRDELPEKTIDIDELSTAIQQIEMTKPVIIDLKTIRAANHWYRIRDLADQISKEQGVGVWFITSMENAKQMTGFCDIIRGRYQLLLYNQGGQFCT